MARNISQTILVIFPGALGDFICFLPVLDRLGALGRVDLLARSEYRDLLAPTIEVRSLECYEIRRLFVEAAERDERLVDFYGSYSSVYSWMGSREGSVVERLRTLVRGQLRLFPFRPAERHTHQLEYYLSCIDCAATSESVPVVPLKADALAWSFDFWRQRELAGKKVLALAPGSGAREKNWSPAGYREVAAWWTKRTGGEVLVILGPVEEERGGCVEGWRSSSVAQNLSLARLAALLARSDLYLGNDSGVTHLAAALGVQTVALFGPTDPIEWGPRGNNVTVLSREEHCSPCATPAMKTCPHRRCLAQLTPQTVVQTLQKVWKIGSLTRVGSEIRVSGDIESAGGESNAEP